MHRTMRIAVSGLLPGDTLSGLPPATGRRRPSELQGELARAAPIRMSHRLAVLSDRPQCDGPMQHGAYTALDSCYAELPFGPGWWVVFPWLGAPFLALGANQSAPNGSLLLPPCGVRAGRSEP